MGAQQMNRNPNQPNSWSGPQPQQQQSQGNGLPFDPKRAPTTVDPNDRIKKQGYFNGNNWPSYNNMNNYYPNSWQYQQNSNQFEPIYSGANGPSPYYQNQYGNNQGYGGFGYGGYANDGNGQGGPYGYGYDNSMKGCASYPCYNNGVKYYFPKNFEILLLNLNFCIN